jgi:hypothetical protein
VNRRSNEAQKLERLLRQSNVLGVDGRRLERWSHDQMLWPSDWSPSLSYKVEHCRVLVELTGQGKNNDRAARVMLARGYPTDRSRDALARSAGYQCADGIVPWRPTGPEIDTSTDAGFAALEYMADEVEHLVAQGHSLGVPSVIVSLMQTLLRWAATGAEHVKDIAVSGVSATPEQVTHSLVCNMFEIGIGRGPYDLSWIFALADIEPTVEDGKALDQAAEMVGGGAFAHVDRAIAQAPLSLFVVMASLARYYLGVLHHGRPTPALTHADDRDDLAALLAPVFVGMLKVIHSSARQAILEDIQEVLQGNLPPVGQWAPSLLPSLKWFAEGDPAA